MTSAKFVGTKSVGYIGARPIQGPVYLIDTFVYRDYIKSSVRARMRPSI